MNHLYFPYAVYFLFSVFGLLLMVCILDEIKDLTKAVKKLGKRK